MAIEKAGEKQTDHELHFAVSDFSILTLDLIFNNKETYGAVDYFVLYENGIARAYLSQKGREEAFKISASLLDDNFVEKLFVALEEIDARVKGYIPNRTVEENIITKWKESKRIGDDFRKLYRLCEQPFQQALEQEILKHISQEALTEVFLQGSFDKIEHEETRKLVERILNMGKMKLKLHENSEKFFSDNFYMEFVSKKHGLPMRLVNAMRAEEFEEALTGKISIDVKDLEERLAGCIFVREDGELKLHTGDLFKYWKDKIQKMSRDQIAGNVAFSGTAEGRVVIHLAWNGITNINEGDVLVAGMTNPQMIPLLRKASAIVTDEGGITCHAAIISRELKKPCIVGTKNATLVLKSGDYVRVDAINGIVHILEKTER